MKFFRCQPRTWERLRRALDRRDRNTLRSITQTGPDERLARHVEMAVPRLRDRGWLRIIGHSDGSYVELTDAGREELERAG